MQETLYQQLYTQKLNKLPSGWWWKPETLTKSTGELHFGQGFPREATNNKIFSTFFNLSYCDAVSSNKAKSIMCLSNLLTFVSTRKMSYVSCHNSYFNIPREDRKFSGSPHLAYLSWLEARPSPFHQDRFPFSCCHHQWRFAIATLYPIWHAWSFWRKVPNFFCCCIKFWRKYCVIFTQPPLIKSHFPEISKKNQRKFHKLQTSTLNFMNNFQATTLLPSVLIRSKFWLLKLLKLLILTKELFPIG